MIEPCGGSYYDGGLARQFDSPQCDAGYHPVISRYEHTHPTILASLRNDERGIVWDWLGASADNQSMVGIRCLPHSIGSGSQLRAGFSDCLVVRALDESSTRAPSFIDEVGACSFNPHWRLSLNRFTLGRNIHLSE
jgi:hypothetical protein